MKTILANFESQGVNRHLLAHALATGRIVLAREVPPEPQQMVVSAALLALDTPDFTPPPKPSEPWRRGRPLR